MSHTPGPWTVESEPGYDESTLKIRDKASTIAIVIDKRYGFSFANSEANARLIAAAPDLLAACQRVERAINWSYTADRLDRHEMAAMLAEAIAKAGGDV